MQLTGEQRHQNYSMLNNEGLLNRYHLEGQVGDTIHANLSRVGQNFKIICAYLLLGVTRVYGSNSGNHMVPALRTLVPGPYEVRGL